MSFLARFQHKREMRESKDEILIGEIILTMTRKSCPAIGFKANLGQQAIRFKPTKDPILHAITITLDRKTGGSSLQQALVGNKAVLTLTAEIKNYIADPDDLLKMYRTDMQNALKIPLLGQVKINHQMNTVFATRKQIIEIDDYLPQNGKRHPQLDQLLDKIINELREALASYKKQTN